MRGKGQRSSSVMWSRREKAPKRPSRLSSAPAVRRSSSPPMSAKRTRLMVNLPQAEQDMLMAPQPLHRFGTPEEVAEAVLWLTSDKSSFVLGSVLVIDGGA